MRYRIAFDGLSALAVLALVAGSALAGSAAPICGDVNASGGVTAADALAVLKSAVGQPVVLACPACPSVVSYGNTTEFSATSAHSADYLLGSPLTIPVSATVTHLAVIAKVGGPHVRMALYTDNAGEPDALVVGTGVSTLAAGIQEIPVAATPIAAGTYWIVAVYDAKAGIGYDASDPTQVFKYRSLPFGDPFPSSFGPALQQSMQRFNYYLRVIQ